MFLWSTRVFVWKGNIDFMQRDISRASVAIGYYTCEVPTVEKLKTYKLYCYNIRGEETSALKKKLSDVMYFKKCCEILIYTLVKINSSGY